MKHKTLSKLKQYIRENRPNRLKSLVRKYGIDLPSIKVKKGTNILHYCCKHGSGPVLRYLLQEGVAGSQQDSAGRTPLHVALHRALELETRNQWDATTECYNELVLPLIERCPVSLSVADRAGDSCRHLLQSLVKRREAQEAHTSQDWTQPPGGGDDERAWRDRLAEEMMFEHQELWGSYELDPSWDSEAEEACDNWADRIREEYYARKRAQEREAFQGNKGHGKRDGDDGGRSDDRGARGSEKGKETLEEARERMRKEFDKNRLKDAKMDVLKQRMKYEERYMKAMEKSNTGVMKYSDVPWPSVKGESGDLSALFEKLEAGSAEYKKYLRDQQIRWHPDKFLQRFGSRICATDRERIIERVTALSQNLNRLKA